MIKTVLFDFVNTLAYLSPSRENILQQFLQEKNQLILEAYKNTDEYMPYSSIKISNLHEKRKFYSGYNQILFNNLGSLCYNDFYDYYNSIKKEWLLYDDALQTINDLKSRDIKVGIISNFDKNLDKILQFLRIGDLLDIVVISAKIQLEKPNIEFYNYVKNNYDLNLTETLYIGDSYNLDYVPSRHVGYESYIIDRNNLYCNVPNRVQKLSDIIEIINHAS